MMEVSRNNKMILVLLKRLWLSTFIAGNIFWKDELFWFSEPTLSFQICSILYRIPFKLIIKAGVHELFSKKNWMDLKNMDYAH